MKDRLYKDVTQAVKDAVKLNAPIYLMAASSIEGLNVETHNVTEQEICVRVKVPNRPMSRHFSVKISESR